MGKEGSVWATPWPTTYTPPAEGAILGTLRSGHPRLMLLDGDISRLKTLVREDATARGYFEALQQEGARILGQPVSERVLIGPRLLEVSRTVLKRVYTLALLYRLTGEGGYLRRTVEELRAAAAFGDWNPSHFLDVAEMTHAFAIGYDWLYPALTPAERSLIQEALVRHGLRAARTAYESRAWWTTDTNNWNNVCNGGITVGALAVADEEQELARWLLVRTIANLPRAFASYSPDGAWEEGPGYWGYATQYSVAACAALGSALGTDFGLSAQPGFSEAGLFRLHIVSPTGLAFNFADAGESAGDQPELFWLGRRFARPVLALAARRLAGGRGSYGDLLWFDARGTPDDVLALPRDAHYARVNVATLRSRWEDGDAFFVGFKGGDNKAGHAHLDLGTFVLDAYGRRFALDLGSDDYNLPGYFGAQRFTYYRLGTPGHNVVVLDGLNQSTSATAALTTFQATSAEAFAIADLTAAYRPAGATRVGRGIALLDGRARVLVQDEIETARGVGVAWTLHTKANITFTDRTAALTLSGRTLEARILEPSDSRFAVEDVVIPPPEKAASGVRRLLVRLAARTTAARVAVLFSAPGAPAPSVRPLADWAREGPGR